MKQRTKTGLQKMEERTEKPLLLDTTLEGAASLSRGVSLQD